MTNNEITARVMEKLYKGDAIKDTELECAIITLEPVVKTLEHLDRRYSLTATDLYHRLSQLKGFREARKRR